MEKISYSCMARKKGAIGIASKFESTMKINTEGEKIEYQIIHDLNTKGMEYCIGDINYKFLEVLK